MPQVRSCTMSDITVYGATGLVGQLVARYLASIDAPSVTLAGRNRPLLAALRDEFNPHWDSAIASAEDATAVERMVQRTQVVITVVGPYTLYGDNVIAACAEHGVDYVDLCGEVPFIRSSIDSHHAAAQSSGARIIPSCGFDSVPSDIGMLNLFLAAGKPFARVDMVVDKLKGGISPGTIDSSLQVSHAAHADRDIARNLHNPYSLDPDPKTGPRLEGLQRDFEVRQIDGIGWVGPFFMSMFNTRVVRRSNALLGRAWGTHLFYKEAWLAGSGLLGRARAYGLALATKLLFDGTQSRLRPLVEKVLPKPGREGAHFQVSHHGITEDGQRWRATLSAQGDPGYEVTAMMLSQAALCLLDSRTAAERTGGILTPATGLGEPYLKRLSTHGMNFNTERVD